MGMKPKTFLTKFFLTILLVLTLSTPGWSTIYYVDADATDGSGTIGSPFQYFFSGGSCRVTMNAGDTVLFKRGTTAVEYARMTLVGWNGSSVLPITIGSYGSGAKPVFREGTAIPSSGWTGPDGNGCYTRAWTQGFQCFLESEAGTPREEHLLKYTENTNCSDGNYAWGDGQTVLYYKPTSGAPTDHILRRTPGNYSILAQGCSYIVFDGLGFVGENLVLENNGANPCHHIDIKNCELHDVAVNAIQITAGVGYHCSYITIDNCTFDYNYNNIYFITNDNENTYHEYMAVRNCVMSHTGAYSRGYDHYLPGIDCDGITCQNLQYSTIEDNDISGVCFGYAGINMWFGTTHLCAGNIIRRNKIHDITKGGGIIYGGNNITETASAEIYDNIFWNVNVDGWQTGYPSVINVDKVNDPTDKVKFYNNTAYNCYGGIFLLGTADNFEAKNNIFSGCVSYVYSTQSTINDNIIDYNAVIPQTGNVTRYSATPRTYGEWKTLTGQSANDIAFGSTIVITPGTSWSAVSGSYATKEEHTLDQNTSIAPIEWKNIVAANKTAADGTHIRISVTGHGSAGTTIVGASIGEMAASPSPDFTGTPTRITFNTGNNGVTLTAAQTVVSDEIAFNYDHTKRYGVYIYHSSVAWAYYDGAGCSGCYDKYNSPGDHTMDTTFAADEGPGAPRATYWGVLSKVEVGTAGQANTWQATVLNEPDTVKFNSTTGTNEATIAGLNSANEWHWESNKLYVYSTTDPDTAYTDPGIQSIISGLDNIGFLNASGLYNTPTDFKLQAESPCIKAGTNTVNSIVTHDYGGKPRLTKNSIGAWEYWKSGESHALPGN